MTNILEKIEQQKIDNGTFKVNNEGLLQFGVLQVIGLQVERAKFDNKYLERGREVHEKIEDEIVNKKTPTTFSSTFVSSLQLADLEAERYVSREYNGFAVSGKIDLLGKRDGTTFLFDFKTGQKYSSHPIQIGGYIYLLDLDPKQTVCGLIYEDQEEVLRVDPTNALESFKMALSYFEEELKEYGGSLNLPESYDRDLLKLLWLKNIQEMAESNIKALEEELKEKMRRGEKNIKILNKTISLREKKAYERVSLDTLKVSEFLKNKGMYEKYIKKTDIKKTDYLVYKNI